MSDGTEKSGGGIGKVLIRVVLVVVLVGAIGASVFLYTKYRSAVEDNPKTADQRAVTRVRDVFEGAGDEPTVVTVVNAGKLTDPELAKRAQDNDKILIYQQDKRLVIFRPSSNKIVDILTITDSAAQDVINDQSEATSADPEDQSSAASDVGN